MTDETKNNGKGVSDGQNGENTGKLRMVKGKAGKSRKNAPASDFDALAAIQSADGTPIEAFFDVVESNSGLAAGVWYYGVGVDKDGLEHWKKPVKLSDPFRIIGRGQDLEGLEYRVIEFKRNGKRQREAMPLGIVGRPDGWEFLRSLGIGVKQSGATMGLLADYIQWEGSREDWQIVKRGGWCDNAFSAYVLPSGEIIGNPENKVIYIGDTSKREAFQTAGSLEQWREEIGRYVEGNSRLMLALGMVLAAPLLKLMRQESGGFHFFGSSSIGKSISGLIAVSALGEPTRIKVQWKGTSLGFDNEAAANNDGLLFLDEISEADPKTAKDVAYSIFNGVQKLQGAAKGGNRARLSWTVGAVSTGEFDLESYLRAAGFELNAGQAVRLPSIPADGGKGYGVFDTLHGFSDGRALAVHLEEAAKSCYGHVFRAYLSEMVGRLKQDCEAVKARIKALQHEFETMLPPDFSNQPARAAKRFVLAAAALELAAEWGVTGFGKGAGFAGVLPCFAAWFERDGGGNREEMQIRKNARDFLQGHGRSGKHFVNLASAGVGGDYQADYFELWGLYVPSSYERGGLVKPRYYITDKAFEEHICKGFDVRKVCHVLADCGWLKKDGRNTRYPMPKKAIDAQFTGSRRMYCLEGDIPPDEWEDTDRAAAVGGE